MTKAKSAAKHNFYWTATKERRIAHKKSLNSLLMLR